MYAGQQVLKNLLTPIDLNIAAASPPFIFYFLLCRKSKEIFLLLNISEHVMYEGPGTRARENLCRTSL